MRAEPSGPAFTAADRLMGRRVRGRNRCRSHVTGHPPVWAHDRGWFGWRSLVELTQIKSDASAGDADLARRLRDSGKDDSHEVADLARGDYPPAMRKFVRYEPVTPEDKAEWSSYRKPEDYLREQWRRYLVDAGKRYAAGQL